MLIDDRFADTLIKCIEQTIELLKEWCSEELHPRCKSESVIEDLETIKSLLLLSK